MRKSQTITPHDFLSMFGKLYVIQFQFPDIFRNFKDLYEHYTMQFHPSNQTTNPHRSPFGHWLPGNRGIFEGGVWCGNGGRCDIAKHLQNGGLHIGHIVSVSKPRLAPPDHMVHLVTQCLLEVRDVDHQSKESGQGYGRC